MKLAIQLYTLREPARDQLAMTLKRARDIGFKYAQWSGMPELSGPDIRAFLDAARMTAIAGHCSIESFELDYEAALAHWRTVGVEHLAPGGMMPECRESHAEWLLGAVRLETLGKRLLEDGITLSYHNHDFELKCFEGDVDTKLDLLYRFASPQFLKAEFDVAWLAVAGEDPAGWLRRHRRRCPVIHVKDVLFRERTDSGPVFTALGDGNLDWDVIMQAAYDAGVEWCVYEQDSTRGDLWEDVRRSYAFMQQYLG